MDRSQDNFSVFVSESMNSIGYNQSIVEDRRRFYKRFVVQYMDEDFHFVCAGSKGEGCTSLLESDIDNIIILHSIACVEHNSCSRHIRGDKIVYRLEREFTAPGYTRLSYAYHRGVFESNILCSFESSNALFFLNMYVLAQFGGERILVRNGPACTYNSPLVNFDAVPALPCTCPSILVPWIVRHRNTDWPSEDTIMTVSNLDAHVVPVGFKLSPDKDKEWRICFTLGELELVHSFNDTQMKVYILLKLLAKSVLKPVCSGMTSYVMKNVMFWTCEWTPTGKYPSEKLIERLLQSLKILYRFVEMRFVPNYMIPARNLLLGNVDYRERTQLLSVLGELIDEGGGMLLRCDKMRDAMVKMYKTPGAAKQNGEEKDMFERFCFFIALQSCTPGGVQISLENLITMYEHVLAILWPVIVERVAAGEDLFTAAINTYIQYLS